MPNWLVVVIVVVCVSLIWLALIGALLIKFDKVINAKNKMIKELQKDNIHKQQLLDAYGVKEITISREE